MTYVFFSLLVGLLGLVAWSWLRRQQWLHRAGSLRMLLDGADGLERQLQECRDRMHHLKTQLIDLPEEMSADAQNALMIDAKVQVALRDLLAHRLWIKHHAEDATQRQLDQACTAMQQSRRILGSQLQRLTEISDDLARARALSSAPTRGY